jgi:hypothetical protein
MGTLLAPAAASWAIRRSLGVSAGAHRQPRSGAGGGELGVGSVGKRCRTGGVGDDERGAQRLTGVGALIGSPQRGAEIGQGARVLSRSV